MKLSKTIYLRTGAHAAMIDIRIGPPTREPNYYKIPVTLVPADDESAGLINGLVDEYQQRAADGLKIITRTPSGGISFKGGRLLPAWDIRANRGMIELTAVLPEGCFRIQFSNGVDSDVLVRAGEIRGHQAFNVFKKVCDKFGVDLESYRREDGVLFKQRIEPAEIGFCTKVHDITGITFEHCHHIDRNSSYQAGLIQEFPEFEPVVRYLYDNRQRNDGYYKKVLNMTQGFFQSKFSPVYYQFSHLSEAMIRLNNQWVRDMCQKLVDSGRTPLLKNTDGVWYTGDIYHDENEGSDLGQWKTDHVNCIWRAKSKGCYEFIENGVYTPVARGVPRLKSQFFKWGDIFDDTKCHVTYYTLENQHIFKKEVTV